jgi:hypothetical protein
VAGVDIVVSDEARSHIAAAGGTLYVRSRSHRCCSGPITMLEATTETPADLAPYRPCAAGTLTVMFASTGTGPAELTVELRGRKKKRPVAYWDGCAFRP